MNPKKIWGYIAIPKTERQISLILIVLLNCVTLYYFFNQSPNITEVNIVEKNQVVVNKKTDYQKTYSKKSPKEKYYSNSSHEKTQDDDYLDEIKLESTSENSFTTKKINVELNSCSREDLIKLKGIGEKLSTRIIKYRDLLGGFVSVNQLNEVYGIKPEVLDEIRSSISIQNPMSKINLNTADFKTLIRHPYIDKPIVKSILNYKNIHGEFKSVDDLKRIYSISDSIFVKIEPYLKVE